MYTSAGMHVVASPSEPSGKYDAFISEYSAKWPISLDSSSGLEESLLWQMQSLAAKRKHLLEP